MRHLLTAFALLAAGTASAATAVSTDPYASFRDSSGHLLNRPVYDENSKSYFVLVPNGLKGGYGISMSRARSKAFKGVRGRLAIIRSRETQRFVNRVLRPTGEAWIGLRMYCNPRVLFWSDGSRHKARRDFAYWGRNWRYARTYQPCKAGSRGYAGVTLSTGRVAGYGGDRLTWYVIDPGHGVEFSIVEYPTGER